MLKPTRETKDTYSVESLLSKGEDIGGRRSRNRAKLYLKSFKSELNIHAENDSFLDPVLEDVLIETALAAGWYQSRLRGVSAKTWLYIAINCVVVVALPLAIIGIGKVEGITRTSTSAGQLTTLLTGILGLQRTLSTWYSSQQRYAAWFKAAADLKSIYYRLVETWCDRVSANPHGFVSEARVAISSARQIIDNEQLDFYQKLTLPTFDILDLLTCSRSNVSTFVTSLLPGAPPTAVSIMGRTSFASAPSGAPLDAATGAIQPIAPLPPGIQVRAPGATKPQNNPYTIVIIANPALESGIGTDSFYRDPILDLPARFEACVQYIIQALFGRLPMQAETFLASFEPQIRVVSIFDPTLTPGNLTSLVSEDMNSIALTPRQTVAAQALAQFDDNAAPVKADVVFAVTASTEHTRSSSYYTHDDPKSQGIPFSFNGMSLVHGYTNLQPGIVALHIDAQSMTALHEFSHAASSWENGAVLDLYVDTELPSNPVPVNLCAGRPIPDVFGTYNTSSFATDPNRAGLGYPPNWQDYHCALVAPQFPALMDDYGRAAGGTSEQCRHDQITLRFLVDRIQAICGRP